MTYARIACTGCDLYVSLTGWSITNGTLFDKCLFHEITIDKQFCPNGHVHRLILIGNDQLVFDNGIRWNRVVDRSEWWTHIEIRLHADKGGVTIEVIDLESTLITIENGDLRSPKSRERERELANDVEAYMRCVEHLWFEDAWLSIEKFDSIFWHVERGEKRRVGRFIPDRIEDGRREYQFTIGQVTEFLKSLRHRYVEVRTTVKLDSSKKKYFQSSRQILLTWL